MKMNKPLLKSVVATAANLALTASAWAHTVWLEPDAEKGQQYHVKFGGHAGKLEPLEPRKLTSVEVHGPRGESLPFQREDGDAHSRLTLPAHAAWVAISYDNGIWTKSPMGESINRPLNQVPGAQQATRAIKFHKTIIEWGEQLTRPLGQTFEVVPLAGHQPRAGQTFAVRVLRDGKPAAGVQLGRGEKGDLAVTDAQGIGHFIPEAGFNKLWAGQRLSVEHDHYTELSYEYLLGFTAAGPQ